MAILLIVFLMAASVAPIAAKRWGRRVFPVLAVIPAVAFGITLAQGPGILAGTPVVQNIPWVPDLDLGLNFRLDDLSWILALVVTGVGALVLLYCTWYFRDDEPSLGRFAALLVGFAGTMYGLVAADDIIVMFIFWEITSVLSYLLIGHYTGKKESRGAALQALLVTTFGGLIMLVGIIILSAEAGSGLLSEIVAAAPHTPAATWAIVCVLVGALSKSAIIPFHFWLPAAMAAPTPVSAYLHAAAMVKAGIYLIARLAPGFADMPSWTAIIIGLGGATMLLGAWRSLRQYDLKLILAYGTVSQLGFLAVMVGFGTRETALAGIALVLAHALYKSTLFLAVGIIDHRAGTRDWRQLSGVGRRAPALAVITALAAASMAGLPPLLGFVAKEAVFTSLLEEAVAGRIDAGIALVVLIIGSIMTVAYTARFLWGAFARRAGVAPTPLAPSAWPILLAPGILALAGVAGGVAATALDPLLSGYANTLPGAHTSELALWHGWTPALGLSALVVLAGLGLFWQRRRVARLQDGVPAHIDAARGYGWIMRTIDRTSARVTIFAQRGGLPQYLATILFVFVLSLGITAFLGRIWPSSFRPWDHPVQPLIAAIMIVAAIASTRAKQRTASVLLVGVTGYGLVVLFAMHGAPDLALTQALVETITIVTFILVLRRLPNTSRRDVRSFSKASRAIIATLVGAVMGFVGLIALGVREQGWSIAAEFPRMAYEEGFGRNIVNVMLVDIRAWDTMGEIAVLVVVATGITSLLFVSGRMKELPRVSTGRPRRRRRVRGAGAPTPIATISTTRQSWLLGGSTLSEANRSLLIEVLVRLIFHPMIIVSIYLLFVGHNEPGGGFAGGLIAGLALVFRYLAAGRYELGEAAPFDAGKVLGLGLLLTVGSAVVPLFFGQAALASSYIKGELPILGEISIGTTTIFDIGVYLVVVGLILDILRTLGAEIDRQQGETDIPEQASDEFSSVGEVLR